MTKIYKCTQNIYNLEKILLKGTHLIHAESLQIAFDTIYKDLKGDALRRTTYTFEITGVIKFEVLFQAQPADLEE